MEAHTPDNITNHVGHQNLSLSKEWELLKDRYKIEKIIGSGASGLVVRAKDRANNKTVAIKYVRASFKDRE